MIAGLEIDSIRPILMTSDMRGIEVYRFHAPILVDAAGNACRD
jgi:hypothetical protein